ncbi:cupin domain-containing protein [Cesiribacter sp. SM1]|uniref:cupin domain-containing protein n=1 Tax=Cesiribacter sp. SM1 TaxID=2861196 RepID=UPI001CD52B17|nr:cupin domain-containing protein [Cesiribacter sp. SM1]
MQHHLSLHKALASLQLIPDVSSPMFAHGTLLVELYKPHLVDRQTPHERDEVYIIASGSGRFRLEENIAEFRTGDFLFVPAGARHQFIDFTADFSVWVLFYGPPGGEEGIIFNFLS